MLSIKRISRLNKPWSVSFCIAVLGLAIFPCAPAISAEPADLTQTSLEDLLSLKVTSVSKRSQKMSDSAAAIYVITQEDIRRSGMKTLPDLFRMSPGMQVGQIDTQSWSVGARGFSELFSNKLLVLVDGRSVYNPLFSGVWWDTQDVVLEDIDRIEIIRGPGATLWGANAVNGVINIVTKSASDTEGALTHVGYDNSDEPGIQELRYGGSTTSGAHYRAYFKSRNQDNPMRAAGDTEVDDWSAQRGGFRMDWDSNEDSKITLQGDIYDNKAPRRITVGGFPMLDNETSSGNNILFRWNRVLEDESESSLQLYYDRTKREGQLMCGETRSTWDFDYQRQMQKNGSHQVIYGLGYRNSTSYIQDGLTLSIIEPKREDQLFSSFIQDEITIKPELLKLTVGSKFEHNSYTGFEVQPNARVMWTPSENRSLWAAVSRAVRTPSETEYVGRFVAGSFVGPGGMPMVAQIVGNSDFDSETLTSHELGYRVRPMKGLSFDAAAYYNVYRNVRSLEPGTPYPGDELFSYMIVPLIVSNKLAATSRGMELAANWDVNHSWRIAANYSWTDLTVDASQSLDTSAANMDKQAPKHQYSLRSYLTLTHNMEFDAMLYHFGKFLSPSTSGSGTLIPAYTRLDLRLGWERTPNMSVSVGVRNALDNRHAETQMSFGGESPQIGRQYYCSVTRRF